jgi:N-methylhydantoinase A
MALDVTGARAAVATVAEPLELSVEAAAFSIIAIANETMINAIKEITVSEGVDPREAVVVAGGGAAGLSILQIARELGCRAVLIPRAASVLSACGMQFADIQMEQSASAPAWSGNFDTGIVNDALDGIDRNLEAQAAPLVARGFSDGETNYRVDAHYAAQVWEIAVPLPSRRLAGERDVETLIQAFHDNHERIFSVADPGSEIEFLNWTGRMTLRLSHAEPTMPFDAPAAAVDGERRRAWFELETSTNARVVRGAALEPGAIVSGPALIEEETTTVVIPPGLNAQLSESGNFIVDLTV